MEPGDDKLLPPPETLSQEHYPYNPGIEGGIVIYRHKDTQVPVLTLAYGEESWPTHETLRDYRTGKIIRSKAIGYAEFVL